MTDYKLKLDIDEKELQKKLERVFSSAKIKGGFFGSGGGNKEVDQVNKQFKSIKEIHMKYSKDVKGEFKIQEKITHEYEKKKKLAHDIHRIEELTMVTRQREMKRGTLKNALFRGMGGGPFKSMLGVTGGRFGGAIGSGLDIMAANKGFYNKQGPSLAPGVRGGMKGALGEEKGAAFADFIEEQQKREKRMPQAVKIVGIAAALAGAAGLGKLIIDSSPMMKAMLKLMNVGIMFILRPIGDMIGIILRPLFIMFVKASVGWFKFWKTAYPTWKGIGDAIGDFFADPIGMLAGLFPDFSLPQAFGEEGLGIPDDIIGGDFWNQLRTGFESIVSMGKTLIDFIVNSVWMPLRDNFGKIITFFKDKIFEPITEALGKIDFIKAMKSIGSFVSTVVSSLVGKDINKIISSVGEFLTSVWNTLVGLDYDTILSTVKSFIDAIGASLTADLAATFTKAVKKLKLIGEAILEHIRNKEFKKAIQLLGEVLSKVASTITTELITGFVDGLKTIMDAVIDIAEFISDPIAVIKSYLGFGGGGGGNNDDDDDSEEAANSAGQSKSAWERIAEYAGFSKAYADQTSTSFSSICDALSDAPGQAVGAATAIMEIGNTFLSARDRIQSLLSSLAKTRNSKGKLTHSAKIARGIQSQDDWKNFMQAKLGCTCFATNTSFFGASNAMASGGIINEPILGIGRSGKTYSFGESGPETVTPGTGGGGARINITIYASNVDDIERKLKPMLLRVLKESTARTGIV